MAEITEIIIVTYERGGMRKIATQYRDIAFTKIKEEWPTGDARNIQFYAIPKTAIADPDVLPWKITWDITAVLTDGILLDPGLEYVGRFS